MEIKPEYIVAIVIVLAMGYFLFGRSKSPKEKRFRCARCSNISQHTPRTINAWRDGKSKFFCNSCHSDWVRSNPQRQVVGGGSRSGCLGVLTCLLFIPLALVIGWFYA